MDQSYAATYQADAKQTAEREFTQAVDRLLQHEDLCDLLEILSAHIGNSGKDIHRDAWAIIHDASAQLAQLD